MANRMAFMRSVVVLLLTVCALAAPQPERIKAVDLKECPNV